MLKLELPIKTVSEANSRDHWSVRNTRKNGQQQEVRMEWLKAIRRTPVYFQFPLTVRLIRTASRKLDDDNLRSAFKGIRDEVARLLGVDDGDDRVRYEYDQTKRGKYEYGVIIEVSC